MAEMSEDFCDRCSQSPQMMVGALVDSIPHPLIVRNLQYRVVLANEAAREQHPLELLECECGDEGGVEACPCRDCPAREAVAAGQLVEREVRDPESGRYLIFSVFPMRDDRGKICGVVEGVRDVSRLHRSMKRIRELLGRVSRQNQQLQEWRRSLEYELKTAREIQMMLVPDRPLCVARMCFDFLYRPSGEIGGDLYDVLPVDDGQVGLLVSDASGHGVGAALIAAMVRMAFRSPEVDKRSPGQVLEAINERLVDVSPTSQFATAFYGVYQPESRHLRYAGGGHPAPLLVRDGRAELLEEGGIVLGSVRNVGFEVQQLELEPGDKLLLYTDGVLDAQDHSGERFGPRRLRDAAGRHSARRAGDFLHGLVGEIDRFMDAAEPDDDLTLVLGEPVGDERQERQWLEEYSRP